MQVENEQEVILETRKIIMDFPGQRALEGVDFDIRRGEVHALIGENGAGKSTLVKIIAGIYTPNGGEILMEGKRVHFSSPEESQSHGLAFIHQELHVIPHLSVAENIFLGRYPRNRFGMVRQKKMEDMVQNIPNVLPMGVDMGLMANRLSIIQQWKMVINRALGQDPRIIFMDEPTSSLTHDEVQELFSAIQNLKLMGKSIVYISHRLEEVFQIADRVTVIKDAKKVGTTKVRETDMAEIYRMMLGRELAEAFPEKAPAPRPEISLSVKNLSQKEFVKEISFDLYQGEILGIAGLVGSGRTELARMIFGADCKRKGEIQVEGKTVEIRSPKEAIAQGIALVPEERRSEGLVLTMDVKQNITIARLSKILRWLGVPHISRRKEKELCEPLVQSMSIKTQNLGQRAEDLSGGNQQKVVLAKWLFSQSRIFIFDEPTRGIDVGAKFAIYELIVELARKGAGILLISSDLTEIVGLAHRILVMDQGDIKTILDGQTTSLSDLLQICLGERNKF